MFETKLRKLRRLGYAWLVLQGIVTAVAPRIGIRLGMQTYGTAFENVGDLEPKEWYVDSTRAAGVGMIVTGLTGLFLEGRRETEAAEAGETGEESTEDEASEQSASESEPDSESQSGAESEGTDIPVDSGSD